MTENVKIQINKIDIPFQIIQNYSKLEPSYSTLKEWKQRSEEDLWEELVLCILSSNLNYETAASAFVHLQKNRFLDYQYLLKDDSFQDIANELCKSIFLPKKKDGSLRKYRFPNVRANNIVKAARVIYHENRGINYLLNSFNSEYEAREFFSRQIPGIGFKEASHFLRNIKYSSSLAIIDTHIINFLEERDIPNNFVGKSLNVQKYLLYEKIMKEISSYYDYKLPIFDLAIWQYMRAR